MIPKCQYWRHLLIAFVLALGLLNVQAIRKGVQMPVADAVNYLIIAHDLHSTGIFGNGAMLGPQTEIAPGRFIAPLYPGLLAGLMRVDSGFAVSVDCIIHGQNPKACPLDFGIAIPVQMVITAFGLMAAWVLGRQISGSVIGAWLTFVVALSSKDYLLYASQFLTESLYLPLMGWSFVTMTAWIQNGRPRHALMTGILLSLSTMTRPAPLYLIYACVLVTAIMAWMGSQDLRRCRLIAMAAFCGGAILVLGPWMIRNQIQFGSSALTAGYAPYILVQRVAYNLMSWQEWCASFIAWFPDIGDNLASALFQPDTYRRLDYFSPDSYYLLGNGPMMQTLNSIAAEGRDPMSYLLHDWILAQPVKHLAVTIALVWRGIWIGKWWGVVGLILLIRFALRMWRQKRFDFLALTAMTLFLVGLNAFVSVSIPRYNLIIVPLIAVSTAIHLRQWWDAIRKKYRPA